MRQDKMEEDVEEETDGEIDEGMDGELEGTWKGHRLGERRLEEWTDGDMEGGAPNPICWAMLSPRPGCCLKPVTQGSSWGARSPNQPPKSPVGFLGEVDAPR